MEHVAVSPAVVLNIPVITNMVLQNLSAKSLNTCARVCKTWNMIAETIKQKRKSMACYFVSYDEDESVDGLASGIISAIQDLRTEPSVLFMYCTSQMYEQQIRLPTRHQMRHRRASKCMKSSVGDFLKNALPKKCKLLAASSEGIIGTSKDLRRTAEIESDLAMSCLFLPHIEGVEFFTFHLDIYNYANQMDDTHSGQAYLTERNTVPGDRKVKAVFFFCDEPFCPPEIGYSLLQMYDNAVIAGGYVDNLITSDPSLDNVSESGSSSLMCVALCGPQVRVASVVIKEDIHKAEEVEEILKQLKDCNLPEERSYAFMFACLGRGTGHYGNENVESSVFRKMFPKTPLLGFFGNGEIGFNFLKKYQTEAPEASFDTSESIPSKSRSARSGVPIMQGMTKPLPKLYHAYTTIICMVSVV